MRIAGAIRGWVAGLRLRYLTALERREYRRGGRFAAEAEIRQIEQELRHG